MCDSEKGFLGATCAPLTIDGSSSADSSSAAVCGRSLGSRFRQFMMSASSAAGTSGRRLQTVGGSCVIRAASSARGDMPANGGCPVNISYAVMPNA